MRKSKVIIEFDNKLQANAFAMYLEEIGMSDYVDSGYHETAVQAGADPLEGDVSVHFDDNKDFPEHRVETIE